MPAEPEAVQVEPPAWSTPKPASRAPTKPSTRVSSAKRSPRAPSPQPAEPPPTESAMFEAVPEPAPVPVVPEVPSGSLVTEPAPTEPAAAEEEDGFTWGQPKSKAGSRKGSKAASKAASKATSKVASKAATPKGAQTPKPPEITSEGPSAGVPLGSPIADWSKPPSGGQTPLATVREDPPAEEPDPVVPGLSAPPGGFFVANPDETQEASEPPPPLPAEPPAQGEAIFSGFGTSLSGSVRGSLLGTAKSALGWGFGKKEEKSKPSTPNTATPAWGGFGGGSVAPSVTESAGGGGWGAATGYNSRSNAAWALDGDEGNTANASTADLLVGAGTTDPDPMSQAIITDGGESYALPPLSGTLDASTLAAEAPYVGAETQEMMGGETQEGGEALQAGHYTQEPLTVETNFTAATGDAGEPSTAIGDSPEVEREGAGGEGGEEETGEKPDDEWGAWPPTKVKKKKGGGGGGTGSATPATPSGAGAGAAGGGGDDWATTKKKKKKK